MSGVELNANVLDTLRQGLAVRPLHEPYAAGIGIALVFLAGLLYRLRLSTGLALALGALAVAAVNLVALYGLHTWITPAAPLAAIGAMFLFWRWLGLRQERRELATERTRSRATLHSITDGVVMIGRDGTVAQLNPVAQRLCALSAGEAAGRPVDAVISFLGPERREPVSIAALLGQVALGQPCLERQAILRANNGDERAVQFSLAPAHDGDGGSGEAILAFSDTTDLQILARVIADQASRDELTGLPNRRVFSERLASALSRARLGRRAVALLVVDLDGFQRVNDAFGYEAGDGLLQAVAQRLRASQRPEHTLGRLGNDQFCVIVEDLDIEERLNFLAHRLRKAIAAPFVIQGFKVMTTVSVGIAVYPRDGDDVDSLLSSARCAADRAKRRGGNGVDLYSSEGRVIDLHHAKLAYNLKRALERNELHLVYQPILDARRKMVCSVEALLRWRQDGQLPIDAGEFIPMLEDAGLVATVGEWVLRTACAQAQVWRRLGWDEARVSVNLSARQLLDPDLGETVREALGASGLDAGALCLEVTETAQITDLPQAAKVMAGLHDLGVRLAIDDFGVGYSSLMSLKRLPVDALKIDKSLIHEAAASDGDAAMLTAVVALAHAMSLTVIAEGIETEEHLRFVRAHNVDEVQGYLIGPPVEPDTVLSQWRATLRTA
jgi:diguanylate cyclase (GGDEF)-like protein/PAS domain S-box-containing protein